MTRGYSPSVFRWPLAWLPHQRLEFLEMQMLLNLLLRRTNRARYGRYGATKTVLWAVLKKIGCAWKWDTIPLPPKWPSCCMENDDEPVDGYQIFRPTNRSTIPNAYWSYINQLTETFYGMDFTRICCLETHLEPTTVDSALLQQPPVISRWNITHFYVYI